MSGVSCGHRLEITQWWRGYEEGALQCWELRASVCSEICGVIRERAKQELVSCLLWALHNINTQLKKYVSSDRMIKSLINPQLQYIQMIISSQVSTAQMLNKLWNHIHKCFSDDCKISGWSCWVDYVNDGSKSLGRGNIRRTPESSRHQTWDCESPDHGDLGRNDAVSWFGLNISGRRLPWRSLALLLPSLAPPGQC